MKITRNTPNQLIVENNPIWLAILVSAFALVFVAIGLFSLSDSPGQGLIFLGGGLFFLVVFNLAFIRRTQLILDRSRARIELRRKSLLGYRSRTWDLSDLDRAVIETSRSSKSDTYRAALVIPRGMDAGTHPITLVYSSGRGAGRAVTAINDWLAAPLDSTDTSA